MRIARSGSSIDNHNRFVAMLLSKKLEKKRIGSWKKMEKCGGLSEISRKMGCNTQKHAKCYYVGALFISIRKKRRIIPSSETHTITFPVYSKEDPRTPFFTKRKKKQKPFNNTGWFYLFEHENGIGKCFKLETSNISINLWSATLALAAANRWYSSKTDERHHRCSFLRHPTRQPVRCWKWYQSEQSYAT